MLWSPERLKHRMRRLGNSSEAVWRILTGCGTLVSSNPQPRQGGEMACARGFPLGASGATGEWDAVTLPRFLLVSDPGRNCRSHRSLLANPHNPEILSILSDRFSNGCGFSARTGALTAPGANQSSAPGRVSDETSLASGCSPPVVYWVTVRSLVGREIDHNS